MKTKFTPAEARVTLKLGVDAALRVFSLNEDGEGLHALATEFDVTVHEITDLIHAGRKIDAMPREEKLALIWRHTHRDYKSTEGTLKLLLVLRGGTALVPLESLTENETNAKVKYAILDEFKKLTKPEWMARDEDSLRNGSGYRIAGRGKYAHYINGDFMGFVLELPATEFKTFTKAEAKNLLPAGTGGNLF